MSPGNEPQWTISFNGTPVEVHNDSEGYSVTVTVTNADTYYLTYSVVADNYEITNSSGTFSFTVSDGSLTIELAGGTETGTGYNYSGDYKGFNNGIPVGTNYIAPVIIILIFLSGFGIL